MFSYHELQIPNFEELTLEQLNYIVKKNPRFPGVHHHIALVYINSGEPAKAIEELNTELRYDPANAQARLELGETLLKLNQYHKAADELLIAAKQAPQMPAIQFALAKAYKADGQTAKALEAARKCVELDPRFADGHYLLGQLYRDTDQPDLAKTAIRAFPAAPEFRALSLGTVRGRELHESPGDGANHRLPITLPLSAEPRRGCRNIHRSLSKNRDARGDRARGNFVGRCPGCSPDGDARRRRARDAAHNIIEVSKTPAWPGKRQPRCAWRSISASQAMVQ